LTNAGAACSAPAPHFIPSMTRSDKLPFARRIAEFFRRLLAADSKRYLCDTCKWDYGNVCKRPERPNALSCPDYKKR
jgi:hypothetical protein